MITIDNWFQRKLEGIKKRGEFKDLAKLGPLYEFYTQAKVKFGERSAKTYADWNQEYVDYLKK